MKPRTDAEREELGLSRKKASQHATRRIRRPLMAPSDGADIAVNWLWVIVPAATAIFISYFSLLIFK